MIDRELKLNQQINIKGPPALGLPPAHSSPSNRDSPSKLGSQISFHFRGNSKGSNLIEWYLRKHQVQSFNEGIMILRFYVSLAWKKQFDVQAPSLLGKLGRSLLGRNQGRQVKPVSLQNILIFLYLIFKYKIV